MDITFEFSRIEPVLDRATGNVISWVIGMTATKGTYSAYIDAEVPVPKEEQRPLADWTEQDIADFAKRRALERQAPYREGEETVLHRGPNWYESLAAQIEAQEGAPIRGAPVKLAQTMRWRGEYQGGVEYIPADIVEHKGAAYEAAQKTKEEPETSEAWKKLREEAVSHDR